MTRSLHTVGIIGGHGKTGRQFHHLFRRAGFSVRSTGASTKAKNASFIASSDILIFALPLSRASVLMREELVAAVRKDQLILDVSSLKVEEVRSMLTAPGEVIGMHPLFGPSTDPEGETIIICPARASKRSVAFIKKIFRSLGIKTVVMTPAEHDDLMLTVQVIPHLKSFLMADCLRLLGTDLKDVLRTCTPTYEMEFNIIGRFLDDHPDLYMPIIFRNPGTEKLLAVLESTIREYRAIAASRDIHRAEERYRKCQDHFRSHLRRARSHSEACIRTLLSLS